MEYLKVQGTKLIRDASTGALINTDLNGLQEYNKKRQVLANQKEEINNIKADIVNIKDDLSEIKQLMLQLLDKGSNV
jgi:hypothetical protein